MAKRKKRTYDRDFTIRRTILEEVVVTVEVDSDEPYKVGRDEALRFVAEEILDDDWEVVRVGDFDVTKSREA